MPWYIPSIGLSDAIKKRVCIYLLQRYLGDFLEEKLTVDQLSLDIYNGRGTVENVSLDVQALNALGKEQNLPMEFVSGYLQKVSFKVPWALILKDSTFVEIHGLKLTVQPKQRNECATSMFESMWSSMSNSMQLAQECMNQEASNIDDSQPLEGIEIFAQAIDSILSRVKVKFLNTTIQVEHVPKDSLTGVGLIINIAVIDYSDEAGNDPPTGETADNQEQKKAYIVSSYTAKNFYLEGITLSTVEFSSKSRTLSESSISRSYEGDKEKEDSILTMMQESSLCEDDRDLSDEVDGKPSDRHVILFGSFLGRQEIRMRFKQSEDVSGPKVSIDINLGGLNLFLSPRQVYVLIELANGLSSPDMEDTSNTAPKQECIQKPMTSLDYQRVEQELQLKLHPCNTFQAPGLQGIQGWSTAALDESDNDDNFLPMHPATSTVMYESTTSNVSSSMESSLSSSMASSLSEATSNRRRKVNNIECDPTAKISHFQIKFASLALVLLHEDLLTLSHDTCTLIPSSVKQMQNTAERYFNNIGALVLTGYGKRNFDECRSNFEKACMLNQLRLMAAPIQIECDETTTSTAFSLSGKLTAAKLEVLECLKQQDVNVVDYVRILSFSEESSVNPINTKPCFKMSFKHVEKTIKTGMVRRIFVPKTDIMITLDVCTIEVDITLIDRICALINSPPVCIIQKSQTNVWGKPMTATTESKTKTESQLDIKIASNNLTVKLRFPIPDFRPAHDRQRPPWWKRSVRNSFVTFKTANFTAQTGFQTHQVCQKYIVQAKTVDIFYFEKENSVPLHIGKAGVDEKYSLQEGFNWPRFMVSIYPMAKFDIELDDIHDSEVDIMSQSCYGSLFQTTSKGPFSAKKVVHESDTPHSKTQHEDSDELVIPGDKQEISDFIEQTTRSARIQLDFSLPTVSMQLKSKHIYEVLYNHISSDLLLWEPSAPTIKYPPNQENPYSVSSLDLPETFAMCKSGVLYESDSESSDGETDSRSVYYSVYDKRSKFMQRRKQQSAELNGQSYLTLNLNIGQGVVCMNPPVRDLATNVIPEQHGEFALTVEDVNVFSVTGYKGDDNLGYVCVQAKGAQLHHCDMISSSNVCPPLNEIGSAMPRRLHPTIYKSESGMLGNVKDRGGDREMLSVAVRIQANHETHHVKTVRVALGINKATLRHRMCSEPNSWITQLIDFFNVADYTISGYNAKDVLTELHLHLWDCAIDYRPFYLPLRSVVTLGTFSMSSHLSATANTSTLRFIAEECGLFLSEKAPPRNGTPSAAPVDLKRDYVSVVDLGLFELSLRTNDKVSGINPHIDLRASNNILNIRTCSDSGRALTQLITYFACDGDLLPAEAPSTPTSNFSSPRHNPEEELISVEPQHISNLSKSQHQHVNEMLGEAMEESLSLKEGEVECQSGGAKMFFFPDEGQLNQDIKLLPQVQTDLGDITFRSNKSSDTDEEFCIIGEEAGLGIFPKNGLPEIRWLTEDPLRVIDNHFNIPFGKTDMLKPPKHFPVPTMRYTLVDMTVVWQMYGGNDFKSVYDDKKEKKTVNFSDIHLQENVAFSNVHTGEVIFNNFMEKKKPKMNWTVQGGVNRDPTVLIELQLNKVRFQHEVYPENTTQASRQVLLVTELEIRDRLQSSQINKFLYQHTSQARPKQSHANMIAIKALHIRPDLKLKAQECCLRVSILPLRLNIDQDSLLFLIHFFNDLSGTTTKTEESTNISSKHNTPTHQPPVMTVSVQNEQELVEQAQKIVDDNLLLLLDDVKSMKKEEDKISNISTETVDASVPIYFRKIVFSPDVPIRLDYHGKRLDLTHGPLAGLIMGLGQLNSSELRLRRLSNNHGILGFDKLLTYCLQEWINDIKKNQLPSLLGGVGPMHSLVQFFQGIRDLFWLPIEQYQKDGRIVRGLQRGANSFTTSTAMAALELTSRIIHLIQITAETAYDMMSPGPSVRRAIKAKGRKRRYNQPQDIREGVANAFSVVKEGIGETAENIVRVASHEREQKGYSGAVGGVLRQIPPTFVKPIIIATEATNNVLGGVQNQLLPDARKEAYEKWKNNEG